MKTLLSEKPRYAGQTLGDSMWMQSKLEQACSHRQKVRGGAARASGDGKLLLHGAAGSVWQDEEFWKIDDSDDCWAVSITIMPLGICTLKMY